MAERSLTVDETTILGVRFIRWGLGLFIFGLIFGFGLLGYYFHGTIESTIPPENMARWLREPQVVKEGSLMKLPRPLTEDEITALVAYLRAHQ